MANIPSDAFVYNGHKYYIYSNVADTWEEAETYCEKLGGHLAVINDSKEDSAIYNYIREKGHTNVFFGLSDAKKEGKWTWVDGTKVKYTNWADDQPDSYDSTENYGMFWDGSLEGKWNDGGFTDWWTSRGGKSFICEWDIPENSWTISGTTAKYGSSDETFVTVKGVKSLDGLSINDNVVTVAKASLKAKTVTISKGYTLALADDVSESTTKNSWSLSGTKATYKQTKSAGYTLANNKITYNKKSTENLFTISGVKSTKGLSLNNKVVTVAKSSLNAKKVTISGDGYTLALADDVDEPTTKKAAWSLNNSTATYKSSGKTAGYTLASNGKSITYSKATTASTLATIKGVKSTGGLKVSSGKITLKNSALKNKVTVSGSYEFDFASDYKSATITGSKNSDTITARGKKIKINSGNGDDVIKIFGSGTVTGGNGADIFYFKSSGANVISDYNSEDTISIASGTVNVTIDGDDVILNKKITVEGGANKAVTYIENGIEKTFKNVADDVIYSDDGTGATLTTRYTADNFTPSDYSKYKDTLLTIDASAVDYNLTIEGNKRANKIIGTGEDDYIDGAGGKDTILGGDGKDTLVGGAGNDCLHGGIGNDSLWGGAGDDTLFGGDGDDIFVYKDGDDNDIIADFDSVDKIMVLSELGDYNVSGSDVTFEVGRGKILIQNGADKHIELVDGYGNHLKHYSPQN